MTVIAISFAFFIIGLLIIVLTLKRQRDTRPYTQLKSQLESHFDTSDLDLTGETDYVRCFSHQWAMDNVARRKDGKIVSKIHEIMADNTMIGTLVLAIIVGISAIIFGLLFVEGSNTLGGALGAIFIGALVIMGPNDPKVAQEFLDAVIETDFNKLCSEDYVYVHLAVESITGWVRTSFVIGSAFIIIAPWADALPSVTASAIVFVTNVLIFEPALQIASINIGLAFGYMALIVVVVFYFIPQWIYRKIRPSRKDNEQIESFSQW